MKLGLGHDQALWHLFRDFVEAISYSAPPPTLTSSTRIKDLMVQGKARAKPVAKTQKASVPLKRAPSKRLISRCYRPMVFNYCENKDHFDFC